MRSVNIIKSIKDAGMPIFWQKIAAFHAFMIIILTFISDPFWRHTLNAAVIPLISIGVIAGFVNRKRKLFPWIFLIAAVVLIGVSILIRTSQYYGMNISPNAPLWLEEAGIFFITLFGFNILMIFEKRYQIKGFVIDFSLLTLSVICFAFLISTDLINVFLYVFTLQQKTQLIHLVVASIVFVLATLNLSLLPSIKIKDIILTTMVVFISSHFYLDSITTFTIEANELTKRISWSLYQLSGTLAIFTIFLEDFEFDYSKENSKKLGVQFLWIASITALLIIPIGFIYRWIFELPTINPFVFALASILLTTTVIWRLSLIITNSEKQRKQLKSIAYTDPLTGLANYLGYRHSINAQKNLLVFCINVEDFKSINEMFDRKFGDTILKSLADRLQTVPNILFSARTNGDNFLAVFISNPDNIVSTAKTLSTELGVWDTIQDKRIAVPLTYGASHSVGTIEPEELARQAEIALKTSRLNHTNFTLYNDIDKSLITLTNDLPRQQLREILQHTIDTNYLPIHFQPIYDLRNGSLRSLELLIRVKSKEHGVLLPSQFLEQAKSYGMLTELTKTCIKMVAKHFTRLPNVKININVPPYMLNNMETLNEFIQCFNDNKLPMNRFCIEITEDGDIPTDTLIPAINLLRDQGFSISMDDFGTGYSSLGRLSVLPVDSVKIDRSLLLTASLGNKVILESAISLVKRLGVSVVVEGVETLEQLSLIKQLDADFVQGFLLSKPVMVQKSTQFSLNASDIVAEF